MSLSETIETPDRRKLRIGWLDVARGVALLAMASYHLTWDFEYFGYLQPGTAGQGPAKLYARVIATSFLLLAGFGLALGHGDQIHWNRFWVRFAKIAAAAAAITIGTLYVIPQGYIHFGILHQIALASLIGLAFLRLPVLITFAFALAVLLVPQFYRSEIFDLPWLWWTGLAPKPPQSFDFVPVFPWFSAVLVGIGLGNLENRRGVLRALPQPTRLFHPFAWAGRRSLPIYLIHQIPLFGLVYALSLVAPPDRGPAYLGQCRQSCAVEGSAELCERFCACTLDGLKKQSMLDGLQTGKIRVEDERIQALALQCSMDAQQAPSP